MVDVIREVENIIERACKAPSNVYGYSAWTHHITSVVTFSKQLAEKLGVDTEIAELSALLHDYASVSNQDWYPEHHIHGARLARELLEKYNYPEEKIAEVEHAILAHRGSREIVRKTTYANILASADAMAHFVNIDSLFHLAFVARKMDVDGGSVFIMNKLGRSWKKLSPEAKQICEPYYQAAKQLFTT